LKLYIDGLKTGFLSIQLPLWGQVASLCYWNKRYCWIRLYFLARRQNIKCVCAKKFWSDLFESPYYI